MVGFVESRVEFVDTGFVAGDIGSVDLPVRFTHSLMVSVSRKYRAVDPVSPRQKSRYVENAGRVDRPILSAQTAVNDFEIQVFELIGRPFREWRHV